MNNPSPIETRAPVTGGTVGALTTGQSAGKFSPKSTRSEAQRQRILDALRSGPKTSYDLRCLGCYQSAARVKELRDRMGYKIRTERVTLYDREGYMHPRAARYHLDGEPDGEWA